MQHLIVNELAVDADCVVSVWITALLHFHCVGLMLEHLGSTDPNIEICSRVVLNLCSTFTFLFLS